MRTSLSLHGLQYHASFLSFDLRITLVFAPSVPRLEHLLRLAASCEKEHHRYWGQDMTTQIYEIVTRGVDARDIPVACSTQRIPGCPYRPCWLATYSFPWFRTRNRPARRPEVE